MFPLESVTAQSFAPTGTADWVRAILLGSVGTAAAVVAVAGIGLLMLSGRMPVRRGATVVLGCFVLFSASTIADGLIGAVGPQASPAEPPPPVPAPAYTPSAPPAVYDPYAGASVPTRPTGQPPGIIR